MMAKTCSTTCEFWNSVDGAEKYDADLAEKALNNPEKYGDMTRKTDPIEQARRVWKWWRVNHGHSDIHFFSIAARIVALVQVSSASVECIFSQLELICEITGDNPLEETLICRVLQRCNDYSVDK